MNLGEIGWPVLPVIGWTKVQRVYLTRSGTLAFTNIPQSGAHFMLIWSVRGTDASEQFMGIGANDDTGSNYHSQISTGTGSTPQATTSNNVAPTGLRMGVVPPTGAAAGIYSFGTLICFFYSDPARYKRATFQTHRTISLSSEFSEAGSWGWDSLAAITSIQFAVAAGSLDVGSVAELYILP